MIQRIGGFAAGRPSAGIPRVGMVTCLACKLVSGKPYVGGLAIPRGAALRLLHVLNNASVRALRRFSQAARVAHAPDVKDVHWHIELSDPRAAIRERAAELQSNLIVLGKQGRSWSSEFLLGSVARRTMELASCDVAIVPSR